MIKLRVKKVKRTTIWNGVSSLHTKFKPPPIVEVQKQLFNQETSFRMAWHALLRNTNPRLGRHVRCAPRPCSKHLLRELAQAAFMDPLDEVMDTSLTQSYPYLIFAYPIFRYSDTLSILPLCRFLNSCIAVSPYPYRVSVIHRSTRAEKQNP